MSMTKLYFVNFVKSDYDEVGNAVIFAEDENDARNIFRGECNERATYAVEVEDWTDKIGVRGVLHSQFDAG